MITKSVKSINPFKSVIKTIYDYMKAHEGGGIRVESPPADKQSVEGIGTKLIIQLPIA